MNLEEGKAGNSNTTLYNTDWNTHTLSLSISHTHTHKHTHTHTHTHTLHFTTQIETHTHTLYLSLTHTHTHTHTSQQYTSRNRVIQEEDFLLSIFVFLILATLACSFVDSVCARSYFVEGTNRFCIRLNTSGFFACLYSCGLSLSLIQMMWSLIQLQKNVSFFVKIWLTSAKQKNKVDFLKKKNWMALQFPFKWGFIWIGNSTEQIFVVLKVRWIKKIK